MSSRRNSIGTAAKRLAIEVEAIEAAQRKKLQAIGNRARKILLPYFREHKLTYLAGNGDWFVQDTAGNFIDDDNLPAEILALLMVEIGRGDHLGFYVDDIKPADWKGKP